MPYFHTRDEVEEGLYMHPYGAFVYNQYVPFAGPSSTRRPQRGYFNGAYDSSAASYSSTWAESLEDSPLGAPRTPPETHPSAFMDSWNQAQCFDSDTFHLPIPAQVGGGHHAIEQPYRTYRTHASNSQHPGPSLTGNAVEFDGSAQHMRSSGSYNPKIHHPQPIRPIPIISLSALSAVEASEPKLQQDISPTPLLFRPVSPSLVVQHSKHVQHGDASRRRIAHETDYTLGLPSQPCVSWPLFSHM